MRKVIIFLIIAISFNYFTFSSESRWIWVDNLLIPSETGWGRSIEYESISCADSMNCIAVGNLDQFFRCPINRLTTDGGKTWQTTYIDTTSYHGAPYPAEFKNVSYPDTNLCIIVGDSNYIWRSTDKCQTWSRTRIDAIYKKNMVNNVEVKMLDNNYGCIRTVHDIFRTEDGGSSWSKLFLNLPDSLMPSSLHSISMPEKDVLIIIGLRADLLYYIIYSYDAGKSWDYYKDPGAYILNLYFIDRMTGWATGFTPGSTLNHFILHTTNGGKTWDKQLDTLSGPKGVRELNKIYMDKNGINGVALAPQYFLWRTSNGGKLWSLDTSFSFDNLDRNSWVSDLAFISHNNIYAAGTDHNIFKYTNIETGIENPSFPDVNNNIEVYPNPCISGNKLNIKYYSEIPDIFSLSIYNSIGQKVETEYNTQFVSNFTLEFETEGLQPGIYFLSIKTRGKSIMKPFIIE